MSSGLRDWQLERLASLKTRIETYESAINGLAAGTISSYSLDTGQTKTSITKYNVNDYEALLQNLMSQYVALNCSIYGGGGYLTN